MALWRLSIDGHPRLALGPPEEGPHLLLPAHVRLGDLLAATEPVASRLGSDRAAEPAPRGARALAPTDDQAVWAAGVTFERSREARREEAASGDFYDKVYDADRPELFFKALPGHARGTDDRIGIRADSTWDVPEPELGVVANATGSIVGYVLGNDVSSRSIEGENPLYLPQAKVYEGSCALGPCIVPIEEAPAFQDIEMVLTIHRRREVLYEDSVRLAKMRMSPDDLIDWLFRAQEFPRGVILLTGTSIVPEAELTLEPGDEVTVAAAGLGALHNTVERVGRQAPRSRLGG